MVTGAYDLDLGVFKVIEERRVLRASFFLGSDKWESFDVLGLRLHDRLSFWRGPWCYLHGLGLGLFLLLDVRPWLILRRLTAGVSHWQMEQ
jgi:hypothetical protein